MEATGEASRGGGGCGAVRGLCWEGGELPLADVAALGAVGAVAAPAVSPCGADNISGGEGHGALGHGHHARTSHGRTAAPSAGSSGENRRAHLRGHSLRGSAWWASRARSRCKSSRKETTATCAPPCSVRRAARARDCGSSRRAENEGADFRGWSKGSRACEWAQGGGPCPSQVHAWSGECR